MRAPQLNDAEDLWLWRNESITRENSINKEKIEFGKHLSWLENALRDQNIMILLGIEKKSKNKIGVVRFSKKQKIAEASITINPNFRGLGFSQVLLEKAVMAFFLTNPNIGLMARVFESNTASFKIFTRVGFNYRKLQQNGIMNLYLSYKSLNKLKISSVKRKLHNDA